jgi:nitrite reductase/ring-hydroxylating ferredoxin subunit
MHVGTAEELVERGFHTLIVNGRSVVVMHVAGAFYAYENRCPHQGGPVCSGKIMPRVISVIDADRTHRGDRFSDSEFHLVCPWHGWEFDIATGVAIGHQRFRLRRYAVVERDGQLYMEG